MITLITGVPGSSKTLNTINEVLTNETYKNRPVYYYNIAEVKLDNWQELTLDEAKAWFQLPHGSVVILDECQRLFRPMKYGDKVPTYIEELETHRHLGIDLFVVTQHPKLIDTKVRRLVGRHLHYKRQFGMESATRIEFQKCADDPDDYFVQKESIKKRVKFPKHLYGVYKSSEEHTHKRKIPFKIYGIGIAAVVTFGLLYSAVSSFGDNVPSSVDPSSVASSLGDSLPVSESPGSKALTAEQWISARSPRIPDIPSSSPIYDELTKPQSFPRPQCLVNESTGSCSCYTQQATILDMSQTACVRIVYRGYFDNTRPDLARASGGQSAGNGEASGDGPAPSAHQSNLNALRIRAEIAELRY